MPEQYRRIERVSIGPFMHRESPPAAMAGFAPDVLLLKLPSPGASVKELVDYYSQRVIAAPTLIVADEDIDGHPAALPLRNAVGLQDVSGLETRVIELTGGTCRYDLARWRLYLMEPPGR